MHTTCNYHTVELELPREVFIIFGSACGQLDVNLFCVFASKYHKCMSKYQTRAHKKIVSPPLAPFKQIALTRNHVRNGSFNAKFHNKLIAWGFLKNVSASFGNVWVCAIQWSVWSVCKINIINGKWSFLRLLRKLEIKLKLHESRNAFKLFGFCAHNELKTRTLGSESIPFSC